MFTIPRHLALASLATLLLMAPPHASAQDSSANLPRFEVATIKPVDRSKTVNNGIDIDPSGQVRLNDFDLKTMIGAAFDVRFWQISGGDPWISKEQYDVVAMPPEEFRRSRPDTRHGLFTIDDPQIRQMLQTLLTERFQLRVHRESKTGSIYLLETNGKKLLLQPSSVAKQHPEAPPDRFSSIGWAEAWGIYNTTMPELAKFTSDFYVHRPVTDRTGLAGAFDYRGPHEDSTPFFADQTGSFLRMLNEIGLKLTTARGPVETLVIDHAEPPSPN